MVDENFFKKDRLDTDKRNEAVSSLDSLIYTVDNWVSELQAYSRELEEKKDELEGCEEGSRVLEIAADLREISLPDGCDDLDATPDSIADGAEEAVSGDDTFFDHVKQLRQVVDSVRHAAAAMAIGTRLPSDPMQFVAGQVLKPRLVRPNQAAEERGPMFPATFEQDRWSRALHIVLERGVSQLFPVDEERWNHIAYLKETLRTVLKSAYATQSDHNFPLTLMWFVADILAVLCDDTADSSDPQRPVLCTQRQFENLLAKVSKVPSQLDELVAAVEGAVDCKS